MAAIVVIGDELVCAGFALAGVDTRNPAPADLAAEFAQALDQAALIVLTRRCAEALAPQAAAACDACASRRWSWSCPTSPRPQVDARFARRMRAVLGIET